MGTFVNFGAMLGCTFGAAPSPLIATSSPKTFVGGKPVATEADKGPANILTFGACAVTPTIPCKPLLTQWLGTHSNLKFGGKAALTDKSCIMCSKGGRVSINNPGQFTAITGAAAIEPKCKICGKTDHLTPPIIGGDSNGKSVTLSLNLLKNLKENHKDLKIEKLEQHPFYSGKGSLAAHHIIPCQSMREDPEWGEYVKYAGYDINDHTNGVFLPTRMDVACKLFVALHRSKHDKGETLEPDVNFPVDYPVEGKTEEADPHQSYSAYIIKNMTNPLKKRIKNGEFCKKPEYIKKTLDIGSEKLLRKIDEFKITITRDGKDYKKGENESGCGNKKSIPKKFKGKKEKCDRSHHVIIGKDENDKSFNYSDKLPDPREPLKIGT